MTGRFEHFDARPGGSYRLVLAYADASAAREVRRRLRRGRRHGGHPVDARSGVDIRADDVPDGITLQITRRDCRPRWTISPLPLNAERRLPRSTVLVATATIRVVATEGQIYGRQLAQAGDYTGPHRDRSADGPERPLMHSVMAWSRRTTGTVYGRLDFVGCAGAGGPRRIRSRAASTEPRNQPSFSIHHVRPTASKGASRPGSTSDD